MRGSQPWRPPILSLGRQNPLEVHRLIIPPVKQIIISTVTDMPVFRDIIGLAFYGHKLAVQSRSRGLAPPEFTVDDTELWPKIRCKMLKVDAIEVMDIDGA